MCKRLGERHGDVVANCDYVQIREAFSGASTDERAARRLSILAMGVSFLLKRPIESRKRLLEMAVRFSQPSP